MKKLVIFDMDGTILDTLEDLKNSVNFALYECGYPTHSIDNIRNFVGNGIRKLVERSVPAGTAERDIDEVFRIFRAHYMEHCFDMTRPYGGTSELLSRLRGAGFYTAVVSNKADDAVQDLCRRFFPDLFDFAMGEREGVLRKPAPDMVFAALDALNISPDDAIYIGDSEVDFETAQNSGLDSINVLWGFRDEEFLRAHGVTAFAANREELFDILTN